jgi:hypothetical protein
VSPEAHKYVYGVVPATAEPPARAGIGGAPVQTIVSGDAAAIVSDVPEGELLAGREELTVHAEVLEDALAGGVVLPMRFGAVMADSDAVKDQLLDRHRDTLLAQLAELEGKVELHLRAVFEETALMTEVVRENPEIAALREALHGQDEDATYYDRIRLGEMVAAAVERKRETEGEEILDALSPLALAVEAGELSHERMALNASFLVERERIPAFDATVDELGRARAGRIRLKYTGPLPAHSFVDLAVEA